MRRFRADSSLEKMRDLWPPVGRPAGYRGVAGQPGRRTDRGPVKGRRRRANVRALPATFHHADHRGRVVGASGQTDPALDDRNQVNA